MATKTKTVSISVKVKIHYDTDKAYKAAVKDFKDSVKCFGAMSIGQEGYSKVSVISVKSEKSE